MPLLTAPKNRPQKTPPVRRSSGRRPSAANVRYLGYRGIGAIRRTHGQSPGWRWLLRRQECRRSQLPVPRPACSRVREHAAHASRHQLGAADPPGRVRCRGGVGCGYCLRVCGYGTAITLCGAVRTPPLPASQTTSRPNATFGDVAAFVRARHTRSNSIRRNAAAQKTMPRAFFVGGASSPASPPKADACGKQDARKKPPAPSLLLICLARKLPRTPISRMLTNAATTE